MGSVNTHDEKIEAGINSKLNGILKSAEVQYPFSKKNFVSMRKLVFLWIVGESEGNLRGLLEKEIQRIVEDERMIWIIQSNDETLQGDRIYQNIYEGINCASCNYLNVDMDHLMICPVFLPGCFQKKESVSHFIQACLFVQREMKKRHRYLEWSPFILLHDEDVDMTRIQLDAAVQFMEGIMEDGRNSFHDCCCPGCVISDVNERGQEISEEQKVKIIVMLTVFRNTVCENDEALNPILLPFSKGEENYFFTARALSICEPVKSLLLNRMLAVHHYFLSGRFSQAQLFDNWKHTFFDGNIWKRQLDKVAHDEKYSILTSPIYSNIPRSNETEYEESLRNFCNQYYFAPLMEDKEKIVQEWWKSFWRDFFLRAAGSIDSLDELEENREKIIEKVPAANVRRVEALYTQDLRKSCEDWLVNELKNQQRYVVEIALKPEGRYMQQFRMKKEVLKDILQKIENAVQNQIRCLRQTEFLLNTGGGHVADPQEEAEHWLWDYVNNEPRKITEI